MGIGKNELNAGWVADEINMRMKMTKSNKRVFNHHPTQPVTHTYLGLVQIFHVQICKTGPVSKLDCGMC